MVTGASSTSTAQTGTSTTATQEPKQLATKETFLQLLVAQIKNQNPMNPSDGVQFLSQLAQFTELEQLMDMRSNLSQIRETLTAPAADGGSTEADKAA